MAEADELLALLANSKENRLGYFFIKRIWLAGASSNTENENTERSWERLKFRMSEGQKSNSEKIKKPSKPAYKFLAIAASISLLIALISLFSLGIRSINHYSQNINEIEVPLGSRASLTLPDGSKVWLNSGSKFSYPHNFDKRSREVTLSGEAFFDVKKRSKIPFVVQANELRINVLGTRFNVKCYPDEQTVETVLVEGKVKIDEVAKGKLFEPVTLSPRQKLTYIKKSTVAELSELSISKPIENEKKPDLKSLKKQLHITNVENVEEDISWKEEKLVIRSESLESIARKLERFYNVDITFKQDSIKGFKFSGTLEELSIEEVLRAIATTSPIEFTINKNKIILDLNLK